LVRRILDSPWFYFGLAGLLVVVAVASQFEVQIPSRPKGVQEDFLALDERDDLNVIFILVDTLRADRLGSYGYERDTSQYMDQLGERGIIFADAEAQSSWTKCSMASLWTGLIPPHTGVTRFNDVVPESALLPAEIFQEAGYRTAGIWRNGWVAPNFGFDQGFELYFRPTVDPNDPRKMQKRRPGQTLAGNDGDASEAAIEFLRNYGHEKFFLYIHYMDVHQYAYDQVAAEENYGVEHSDAYDGAIHWTDRNIAYVLSTLEEKKIFDRTLVVIASDHGEAFFEHNVEGHARDLYREVTHVPIIIIPPFILEEGLVIEPVVRNADLWPTVLDMVGLPPLPDADGVSLMPLIEAAIRGEQAPGPARSIAYLDRHWGQSQLDPKPLVAVRDDGRRVIAYHEDYRDPEAFDYTRDPQEQENLAGEDQPPWAGELLEEARAQMTAESRLEKLEVELDEMYKEQLRALGYVIQ
jgi:arylsulfatase A-like enzyme